MLAIGRNNATRSLWFIWFIRLVWCNQINKTNQTNQLNVEPLDLARGTIRLAASTVQRHSCGLP